MTTDFPASLLPADDEQRLRTLHQFQIVNTTPEPIFDHYAAWAAQLFGTPIGLISLVDADYVWFKAVSGAEVPGLVRDESMCSAAILSSQRVIINDYKPESCHLIKPDVAQAIGLNFYAGAQLLAGDGSRLGMLAVVGPEFRELGPAEEAALVQVADLISSTIELRYHYLAAGRPDDWEAAQRELTTTLDENAALARYLASRGTRLDLADPEVSQLIGRRLTGVAQVLARRLAG